MSTRPKLLDLYCCEGGAAHGYTNAGLDTYGIDLFQDHTQTRYPYPSHKSDALTALTTLTTGKPLTFISPHGTTEQLTLTDLTAIHASPPCQHASAGTRAMRAKGDNRHPALIEPTRQLLKQTRLPYTIENVKGAALHNPALLCGSMFNLTTLDDDGTKLHLQRHRLFETNWPLMTPPHNCWPRGAQIAGSYGGARRDKVEARTVRRGGYVPSKRVQGELLGIDWMSERGLWQALPPAFTEFVGEQLLAFVDAAVHRR